MMTFSEMTNGELDRAVAAIMKKFTTRDGEEVTVYIDDDNAELILIADDWRVTWSPSTEAGDFDDVRREIIRRGWSWWCSYNADAKRYYFGIGDIDDFMLGLVGAMADSLQRAGCIAFLQAIESQKGGKS